MRVADNPPHIVITMMGKRYELNPPGRGKPLVPPLKVVEPSIKAMERHYMEPAVAAIGKKIESDLLALYAGFLNPEGVAEKTTAERSGLTAFPGAPATPPDEES